MITITVYQSKEGIYKGFRCKGHAGFGYAGNDIVCAAVSMLVINTINAIEKYADEKFECDSKEDDGILNFNICSEVPTAETVLLLNAMILGLQEVEKQYKKEKYLKLKFKEV